MKGLIDHFDDPAGLLEELLDLSPSLLGALCSLRGMILQGSDRFNEHFGRAEGEGAGLAEWVLEESREALGELLSRSCRRTLHIRGPHDFIESFSCLSRRTERGTLLILQYEKSMPSGQFEGLAKEKNRIHGQLIRSLNRNAEVLGELTANSEGIFTYFLSRDNLEERLATLTKREREIFDRLAREREAAALSETLGISHATLRKHMASLKKKMAAPKDEELSDLSFYLARGTKEPISEEEARSRAYRNLMILKSFLRWESPERVTSLTKREREILTLLREGKPTREIGLVLSISENTVKTHVSRILKKLQLKSRKEIML